MNSDTLHEYITYVDDPYFYEVLNVNVVVLTNVFCSSGSVVGATSLEWSVSSLCKALGSHATGSSVAGCGTEILLLLSS